MRTVLLALLFLSTICFSGEPFVENLWPNGAPGDDGTTERKTPTLTFYVADKGIATGAAVVVVPGGGYGHVAMNHEGHAVGKWLNSHGISAVIVDYRHAPSYKHPIPSLDAKRAMRTVRTRAKELNIDPNRIGILGFSAGGHLSSTVGTLFDYGDSTATDPIAQASCRPDFMVLIYPVISMQSDFTHKGSNRNLMGENPAPELVKKMSTETQITKDTPPTFLILTNEDKAVPAENSVVFYLALRKAGVPAEMHIFEKGRHGFGLGPNDPVLSTWPNICINWMKTRGIIK